jgi:hypothetical protein
MGIMGQEVEHPKLMAQMFRKCAELLRDYTTHQEFGEYETAEIVTYKLFVQMTLHDIANQIEKESNNT